MVLSIALNGIVKMTHNFNEVRIIQRSAIQEKFVNFKAQSMAMFRLCVGIQTTAVTSSFPHVLSENPFSFTYFI